MTCKECGGDLECPQCQALAQGAQPPLRHQHGYMIKYKNGSTYGKRTGRGTGAIGLYKTKGAAERAKTQADAEVIPVTLIVTVRKAP